MKVIDLLEKWSATGIGYIDIYDEDKKELCMVSCPEKWREFLTEKVLNSELVTFSIRISEPCGLLLYIKDEESKLETFCENDIVGFTQDDEVNLSHLLEGLHKQFIANEKKHDDTVDSLIFAKKELDKVIIERKPLAEEIKAIFRDGFVLSIDLFFRPNETHVIVDGTNGKSVSRDLPFGASDAHILDTIKDLIKFLKKGE